MEMSGSKYILNSEKVYYDEIVGDTVRLTITLEFGPQAPSLLVDNVNEFFEAATEAIEDLIGVSPSERHETQWGNGGQRLGTVFTIPRSPALFMDPPGGPTYDTTVLPGESALSMGPWGCPSFLPRTPPSSFGNCFQIGKGSHHSFEAFRSRLSFHQFMMPTKAMMR
jgi:hypothetical protein